MDNLFLFALFSARRLHDFPWLTASGNAGEEWMKLGHSTLHKLAIAGRIPRHKLLFQVFPFIEELAARAGNTPFCPLSTDPCGIE